MLGKDLFKIESNVDLSNLRFKALVLFYNPLIGNDAFCLYTFLVTKGSNASFEEINKLLNSLNISIDELEKRVKLLNQYHLLRTFKKKDEDKYVFVLNNPLTVEEFISDDLLVRDFILKTSGLYYQSLISDYRLTTNLNDFEDVSYKFDPNTLKLWSKDNESFLKPVEKKAFNFNTLFDVNVFLNDMSLTLFPLKYRTQENLMEIAKLADLYNISYDKMRSYIPQVSKTNSNSFDLSLLRYLCQNAVSEYKNVEEGIYNIPCQLFLMNKQEGKEVSPYDKKILYSLANDYKLKPGVINVLLEYSLRNCDNRLIEKFIYPIASDLHRNNIETSKQALERLNVTHNKKMANNEKLENYEVVNNPEYNEERRKELFRYRKGQDE